MEEREKGKPSPHSTLFTFILQQPTHRRPAGTPTAGKATTLSRQPTYTPPSVHDKEEMPSASLPPMLPFGSPSVKEINMRRLMAKCDAKVQADRILQGSERSKYLTVHIFLLIRLYKDTVCFALRKLCTIEMAFG